MSRPAYITIGDMHARLVATEPEILFVVAMRKDRMLADGAMHDAGIMT